MAAPQAMYRSSIMLFIGMLLSGCTGHPPTIKMNPGYVAGNYHVTQFTIQPNDAIREQTYGAAAGTVAEVEEFKQTLTPLLTQALASERTGNPVNMTIDVTLISPDINEVTAALLTDSIRVVTNVTLTDPATGQVIGKCRAGAMAESTTGLFGVMTDAMHNKPTHEQYQQILARKYVEQLMYKLFPGTHPIPNN